MNSVHALGLSELLHCLVPNRPYMTCITFKHVARFFFNEMVVVVHMRIFNIKSLTFEFM
jgi:hypothetical protein